MPDHKFYNAIVNELLTDPRVAEGNLFGVPVSIPPARAAP